MPRLNDNEIDEYLKDNEPRREARKLKKKQLDAVGDKRPKQTKE